MSMFAPVAPLPLMFNMKDKGILGKYHLLLAHDVADQHEAYAELFDGVEDTYIILDNSLIELGHPAPDWMMQRAAASVKPKCIVLPDYLRDGQRTLNESKKAIARWKRLKLWPFMAVIQGVNKAEIQSAAAEIGGWSDVTAIGIPRVITDTVMPRSQFIEYVHKVAPYKSIHLLGFSNNLLDDIAAARLPGVVGIDSAVPLRMGLAGEQISLMQPSHTPRGDFWSEATELTDQAVENLESVRSWIDTTEVDRVAAAIMDEAKTENEAFDKEEDNERASDTGE